MTRGSVLAHAHPDHCLFVPDLHLCLASLEFLLALAPLRCRSAIPSLLEGDMWCPLRNDASPAHCSRHFSSNCSLERCKNHSGVSRTRSRTPKRSVRVSVEEGNTTIRHCLFVPGNDSVKQSEPSADEAFISGQCISTTWLGRVHPRIGQSLEVLLFSCCP